MFRFRDRYQKYKIFLFRLNNRLNTKLRLLSKITLFFELFCFSIILLISLVVCLCFYFPIIHISFLKDTHIIFWCYSISLILFQEFLAFFAFLKLYILIRLINSRYADIVVLQLFVLINLLLILYLFVVFVPCFNLLYDFYTYVPSESSLYRSQLYSILIDLDLKLKK